MIGKQGMQGKITKKNEKDSETDSADQQKVDNDSDEFRLFF